MANIIGRAQKPSYYTPPRKLKNSVASSASDGGPSDFPAEAAGIPDKFATTEHPKLKFLFAVQFFPRSDLSLDEGSAGSTSMDEMEFALRRASRPNISGTYQNVNRYNYRTQVLTKIEYGTSPATLAFYDDNSNRALNFVVDYLSAISPVSSTEIEGAGSMDAGTSDSVGALINQYGPLAGIRVAHHSFDPSNVKKLQSVYYDYINPKIVSINLDELDMTTSDVTNVEISFLYDSVRITTGVSSGGTVTVGDVNGGQDVTSTVFSSLSKDFNDSPDPSFNDSPDPNFDDTGSVNDDNI